jgi:hypothetical protein
MRQTSGNSAENTQPAPCRTDSLAVENHLLEKIHLHGTILFYNKVMAFRFSYPAKALTWVTLALVAIYLLIVFGSRWQDRREFERRESQRQRDSRLPDELSTSELKILQFYASPPAISAGEQALLCYGALNARSLRIEPGPIEATPALSRCVQVSPRRSTRYTLTAEGAGGDTQTATAELAVH